MKNKLINFALLILMAAACVPQPLANEGEVPPVETGQVLDAVEESVVKQLSGNLGLQEGDISVVSNEEAEFSDACLGVVIGDVSCAQVITPGRIIMLEANGFQYEYHTSADGDQIQPATLALTWKREGGIAGFCDNLTVFRSGEVYGNQCRPGSDETVNNFATLLSASEQKQFSGWMMKFGQVTLDASDPKGVSDRMEVTLVLSGMGTSKPGKAEQQAMFTWAQDLFQKLYS